MSRKRANRRKTVKSSRTAQKTAGGKRRGCALSSFFVVLCGVVAVYVITAFIISLTKVECPGTSIDAPTVWTKKSEIGFVVGTKYSNSIRTLVNDYVKKATKLLIIDCEQYPVLQDDRDFYLDLIREQRRKPGLSIYLLAGEEWLTHNRDSKALKNLRSAGITVISVDTRKINDYHWVYEPVGWIIDRFVPQDLSRGSFRNKRSSRNAVVCQTHTDLYALTGNFSLDKNMGNIEFAVSVANNGALAIAKSELYLIREFLAANRLSLYTSASELQRKKSAIESSLKAILNMTMPAEGESKTKFFSENKIDENVESFINRAQPGDNMDVFAGALDRSGIEDALVAAHLRGVFVRIIFDKNSRGNEPSTPNCLIAGSLSSRAPSIKVKWLEGHRTHSSFIHVYNRKRDFSSVVLLSSFMTDQAMNYNLSGGILIENIPVHSVRLEALFATYLSNNATRQIYSSELDKYENGFFNRIIQRGQSVLGDLFGDII